MLGEEDNLADVAAVVRYLPIDGLHHRVRLAPDEDRPRKIRVRERLQRGKRYRPTVVPKLHYGFLRRGRLDKFAVAIAVRLFTVAGQEIGPTRAHVAGHVLDDHGNRVHLGVKRDMKLLGRELVDSAFRHLLIEAEKRKRVLQVRRGKSMRHVPKLLRTCCDASAYPVVCCR